MVFKKYLFYFSAIFLILFELTSTLKIKIGEYFQNTYLSESKYYIQNYQAYSLSFWFRILENNPNQTTAIVLEIRNDQNQFVQLNLLNNSEIFTVDENDQIFNENWPAPLEPGIEDLANQAIIYNKWLPIIISKDELNSIKIQSFVNLNNIIYYQKNFTQNFSAFFDFNPQNVYVIKVVFDFIIFRDQALTSNNQIQNFYYDFGFLGVFSSASKSKNGQWFFNQYKQQFENEYLFMEETQPLPFLGEGYYSNYNLILPNFFLNRIFYTCQYYLEGNYWFQQNYSTGDITTVKRQVFYKRNLVYQQKYFQYFLDLNYQISSNSMSLNTEWKFDDNGTINNIDITSNNIGYSYLNMKYKFNILLAIKTFVNSSFQRSNTFTIIQPASGNVIYQQLQVDYIYSYYDQISSEDQTVENIRYITPVKILKVIFYNEISQSVQFPSSGSTVMYIFIGTNSEVTLQVNTQHDGTKNTANFNTNQVTQIIDKMDMTLDFEDDYCSQIIPNCRTCIDYQCLNCKDQYYLVDGKCLICDFDFMIYQNSCIQRSQLSDFQNFQTFMTIDQTYLTLIKLDIDFQISGQSTTQNVVKNIYIQNQQQIDTLIDYLQNYVQIAVFRASKQILSKVNQIEFHHSSVCDQNQFMEIYNSTINKCVNTCASGKHLVQSKFCRQNFAGCLVIQQGQCVQCEQEYTSINFNGKTICFSPNLSRQQTFQTTSVQIKPSPNIQNCAVETSSGNCVKCNPNYIIDHASQNCTAITSQYQYLEAYAVCSQHDNSSSPNGCIGQYSNSYIYGLSDGKWTQFCQPSTDQNYTCISCSSQNYYLNYLQLCYECVDYDQTSTSCLQCASGFQLLQNECVASNCLNIVPNCSQCDSANPNVCQACEQGFIFLSEGSQNQCQQSIKDCVSHYIFEGNLLCDQCSIDYQLINYNFQIDLYGFLCISQGLILQNCSDYQQITLEYQCTSCVTGYTLLQQYFCIQDQYLTSDCDLYDQTDFSCSQCKANFVCLDQSKTVSVEGCVLCIDENTLISNCYTYTSDLQQCQICLQNFFCLDQNYQAFDNFCQYCIDTNFQIQNCFQYDNTTLECIGCLQSYQCIDSNGNLSQNQCNICINQNQQISNCVQYDTNTLLCLQCEINFVCFNQNFQQDTTQCKNCVDQNLLVENCNQYNQSWQCIQCQSDYFIGLYSSNMVCIPLSFQVQNCSEYTIDPFLNYVCQMCSNNQTPSNNMCFYQIQGQIYISTQQIYIFQDNYVENCQQYDQYQQCISCDFGYNLVFVQISNQPKILCYSKIIYNCQLYLNQDICIECQSGYNINYSLDQCIDKNQCTIDECFQSMSQSILFGQVVDNCVVQIRNCNNCQKNDRNICQMCGSGYKITEQECVVDCNLQNTQLQQENCKKVQINSTLNVICQNIHKDCEKCQFLQKSIQCIQCKYNMVLQNNQCDIINQQMTYQKICSEICLKCFDQTKCIQCPIGFQNINGLCVLKQIQYSQLQCVQGTLCYYQGVVQNQHCTQCKKQCQFLTNGTQVKIDKNIKLKIPKNFHNSTHSFQIDYQKNFINIIVKDYNVSFSIFFDRQEFFHQSLDCTPSSSYDIKIQQFQSIQQGQIIQYSDNLNTILPSLASVTSSSPFTFLFMLLSDMRIFYFLDYIDLIYGKIGQSFQLTRNINVQNAQDQLFLKYFKHDYDIQYIFIQQKIQAEFLNSISIIWVFEILFIFLIVVFYTLKLILIFNQAQYKKYKENVTQLIQKYLTFKSIQVLIGFLSQISTVNLIFDNQKLYKKTLILFTVFLAYVWLELFYAVLRKFQYFVASENQKMSNKKLKEKEAELKLFFNIMHITLLYIKFKLLFDIQKNSLTNQIFFILLNLAEYGKIFVYRHFQYMKIVFYFEIIYNILLILFCILSMIQQLSNFQINPTFLDILIVLIIIQQLNINLVNEIIFAFRQNAKKLLKKQFNYF